MLLVVVTMISKDYGLAYSQIVNLNSKTKTKNLPIILNNNSWKQCFKLLKTLSREIYYLIKAFDSVNLFRLALSLPNQRTCQRSSLKYPNGNCWLNLHYRLCLSFVSFPLKYFKSNLLISFFLTTYWRWCEGWSLSQLSVKGGVKLDDFRIIT